MPDLSVPFARAALAAALLAVDPGLGGLWLRARPGPARDGLAPHLAQIGAARLLHPAMGDEALFGALDLGLSLAAGRAVMGRGVLSDPGALVLPMAERAGAGLAARLALALDAGDHLLIAWDEAATDDEGLAPALADRLAFAADLTDCALAEAQADLPDAETLAAARDRLATLRAGDDDAAAIAILADRLGVWSPRAAILALRAARAHAALAGRDVTAPDDLAAAAALVLAHRATRLPEAAEEDEDRAEQDPPPAPESDGGETADTDPPPALPEEILLDAVRAALPADLLGRLAAGRMRTGAGSGTGAARAGNRRGRPLPARPGRPGGGVRIDLVATLRAAAPWQAMRRAASGRTGLQVRGADLRVKRYEEKSDRLLVFAVDASGSAALARLAEAKGAVELLLAQAYARRDHVALVAFRGRGAELLLPPTRSLVQTKRRLAALPGGGGTPLAAGLNTALALAVQARRRGLTPTAVLLTDGRANIALDGQADRPRAAEDARTVARAFRADGIGALVIDTGNRPEPDLRRLAEALDAPYLPLPRADARRLSAAVSAALED